jgi:hypothetical protein
VFRLKSLYEAAIEAIAAFPRRAFAEMIIRARDTVEDSRQCTGGGTHRYRGKGARVVGWWREESCRAGEEESFEGAVEEVSRCRKGFTHDIRK